MEEVPRLPEEAARIHEMIRESGTVVVTTHIRMDGDAVGSALALREALRAAGKEALLVNSTPIPEIYRFLAPLGTFLPELPPGKPIDLLISVDAANCERLEFMENSCRDYHFANIDHHVSNTAFADVNWVDPDAPCVGEMLLWFFLAYGYEINDLARDALYVSLLTDTGRFSFSNTSVRAFRAALKLAEMGVDPGAVASKVYFDKPIRKLKLLQLAYSRLNFICNDRIAYVFLDHTDLKKLGVSEYDTQEIVDIPRSAASAEVAFFMYGNADGTTRVSVRSKGNFDSRKFAELFGGGGHPGASGITMKMCLEEAKRVVLERACLLLSAGECRMDER